MITTKKRAYYYGVISEWIACFYLMIKGYQLIRHNYLTKVGQIDLIMKRKDTLIFVEVKSRNDASRLECLISNQQKRHLVNAANYFLNKNKKFSNKIIRFDAIYIIGLYRIMHFKNIYDEL